MSLYYKLACKWKISILCRPIHAVGLHTCTCMCLSMYMCVCRYTCVQYVCMGIYDI